MSNQLVIFDCQHKPTKDIVLHVRHLLPSASLPKMTKGDWGRGDDFEENWREQNEFIKTRGSVFSFIEVIYLIVFVSERILCMCLYQIYTSTRI